MVTFHSSPTNKSRIDYSLHIFLSDNDVIDLMTFLAGWVKPGGVISLLEKGRGSCPLINPKKSVKLFPCDIFIVDTILPSHSVFPNVIFIVLTSDSDRSITVHTYYHNFFFIASTKATLKLLGKVIFFSLGAWAIWCICTNDKEAKSFFKLIFNLDADTNYSFAEVYKFIPTSPLRYSCFRRKNDCHTKRSTLSRL